MVNSNNKFARDLLMVIVSNFIVLLSSILTGFIIPRLLGVSEYGYYKIFSLYLGYVGLLHLGFVDGVLLRFAGKEYSILNKKKFRRYTAFFLEFQFFVAVVVSTLSLLVLPSTYKYIFFLLGIDIIAVNLTTYYQFISQSTMRFKELSIIKTLLALEKIILVLFLVGIQRLYCVSVNANIYVSGLVLIDIVLLLWYIYTYRDITFGEKDSLNLCKKDIRDFFSNGIVLTLSYQTAQIIFLLDRQFVSAFFDTETYSVYSFAYSLIAMITTVVSAISLVLFPRLKQMDHKSLMQTYSKGLAVISIISLGAMIGYQPLCWFIKWYLPDYSVSVEYLKIIFPGLAISCCISIIMFTYFKALNAHLQYFKNCCIVLFVGIVTNGFAFYLFRTPSAISIASIITLIVWYLINELYFIKKYKVNWKHNFFYIVLVMIVFYCVNILIDFQVVAWSIYSIVFVFITYMFYKEMLIEIVHRIIRKTQ